MYAKFHSSGQTPQTLFICVLLHSMPIGLIAGWSACEPDNQKAVNFRSVGRIFFNLPKKIENFKLHYVLNLIQQNIRSNHKAACRATVFQIKKVLSSITFCYDLVILLQW